MRAVVQRVDEAEVTIGNQTVGKIARGLLVLVGIEDSDNGEDVEWLAAKIANLRIFDDVAGVMNLSVKDISGEVLLVSQFTLHASTRKGNRPSYLRAARPETATPLYQSFIGQMEKETGKPIQTGKFGAMMNVSLVNSGPVTIIIDTKNRE